MDSNHFGFILLVYECKILDVSNFGGSRLTFDLLKHVSVAPSASISISSPIFKSLIVCCDIQNWHVSTINITSLWYQLSSTSTRWVTSLRCEHRLVWNFNPVNIRWSEMQLYDRSQYYVTSLNWKLIWFLISCTITWDGVETCFFKDLVQTF